MRKLTTFILILALLFSCFTLYGCNNEAEVTIETALNDRYTEILGMLQTSESNAEVQKYLLSWANENDISVSHDTYNNVIMSSKATEGYEDAESNIFQCTVDLSKPEQTALSMSVASYIIQNTENHGFVRVLFTAPGGLSKLLRTYVVADNFISLDWNHSNSILVGSAGTDYYTMASSLEWTEPSYTDAYEIVIEGLPEVNFMTSQGAPNPITIIGDLLATAKSNSLLIEIAEFNGGASADTYPTNVSCTILINQKDVNNVKKRIEAAMDDFYDRYTVDPETFTFTFAETEVPDKVISYEDTARLISFLYTCIDGNYLKDDAGEVIAKANIGIISTDGGNFKAEVCASSKSSDVLTEMETIFETICGLSNISYTKKSGEPVWESSVIAESDVYSEGDVLDNEEEAKLNSLVESLTSAADEVSGRTPSAVRTFEYTPCAVVSKRVSDMNIAGFGTSEDELSESTEILLKYLENGIV